MVRADRCDVGGPCPIWTSGGDRDVNDPPVVEVTSQLSRFHKETGATGDMTFRWVPRLCCGGVLWPSLAVAVSLSLFCLCLCCCRCRSHCHFLAVAVSLSLAVCCTAMYRLLTMMRLRSDHVLCCDRILTLLWLCCGRVLWPSARSWSIKSASLSMAGRLLPTRTMTMTSFRTISHAGIFSVYHPTRAVCYALLRAHASLMLIGARNLMLNNRCDRFTSLQPAQVRVRPTVRQWLRHHFDPFPSLPPAPPPPCRVVSPRPSDGMVQPDALGVSLMAVLYAPWSVMASPPLGRFWKYIYIIKHSSSGRASS